MTMTTSPLISAQALHDRLQSDPASILVCDCRYDLVDATLGLQAYQAGHIPGAIYVNLGQVLSGSPTGSNGRHPLPNPDDLAADLAQLGVNADTLIVAYDGAGASYAARLWWCARWVGHAKVVVLDGAIDAWVQAGFALSTDVPTPRDVGNFKRTNALTQRVDYANIRAGLGRTDRVLIDGRPVDRFQGLNETLDPQAGHIPGSLSRFSRDNVGADFRFKAPEVLRAEFAALLGNRPAAEVVATCGSGVAACHLLLAMELAGLPGAALYGGSWSEWCAQPDTLVETGPARVAS